MSVLPLLVFFVPSLLGMVVLSAAKLLHEKVLLCLVGATLGLTAFTTAAYVVSAIVPLSAASTLILLIATVAGVIAALFFTRTHHTALTHFRALPFDITAAAILLATLALFSIIAPKMLIARPDGLSTGIINAYGDIAWHAANITAFAEGQTIPPQNPSLAGTTLAYPFLTNFFSAMLVATGGSLPFSVNLPAALLAPLLLTLLYCFVRELTGKKAAGVIATLLFLFGGATFGFVRFGTDWQASGQPLVEFLTHLPARDYFGVGTDKIFHFLNPATTLLLPQRSFLFALPLALSILTLLLPGNKKPAAYLTAGVLAGLTPLFHAHTALALVPAIIGFFLFDIFQKPPYSPLSGGNEHPSPDKGRLGGVLCHWLLFLIPAAAIGLPEALYYLRASREASAFLRWGPGWMAGDHNVIWYWFVNTGFLIPATIAGLLFAAPRSAKREVGPVIGPTKALAISGFVIFIVANLFLFAPWAWDNFKLFVYFFVFVLPLVSSLAAQLISGNWPAPRMLGSFIIRSAVVALLALHMLSATLDIWKLALPTAQAWNEFDPAGIAFADNVQQHTQAGESIITAPTHNSPIVLTGRPRYLGFSAHVWSHGGNPWPREAALKEFYAGRLENLPEHTPQYILIGPQERATYPNLVIRPTWQLVTQLGDYQLFSL